MTHTPCNRCGFPFPIRWLRAGSDLAHSNGTHECADHALMRSQHQPKCLLHSPDPAYMQISDWRRPGLPSIIHIGAGIKSP